MSGPMIFKVDMRWSPEVREQARLKIDLYNQALEAGYMSPTGRVSTKGELGLRAAYERVKERMRAARSGTPYQYQAGHIPDTTLSGKIVPWAWLDEYPQLNSSFGAQTRRYPIGYKVTKFILEEPP